MITKKEYLEIKPKDVRKLGNNYYYDKIFSNVTEVTFLGIPIYKKKELIKATSDSSWSKPKTERYR